MSQYTLGGRKPSSLLLLLLLFCFSLYIFDREKKNANIRMHIFIKKIIMLPIFPVKLIRKKRRQLKEKGFIIICMRHELWREAATHLFVLDNFV